MIDKLKQIEDKMLLDLLSKPDQWKTLLVDYHPPMVERCWAQIGNYRIFIHFIHKCETSDALFHPHPWPSAMHVLTGKYEMGLGFGPGLVKPEKMCTILTENGGLYYDMTHLDGWHYVRPVEGVCATVMLTGKPWEREEIKSDEPLKPLDNGRKMIMLEWFSEYYRNRNHGGKIIENQKIKRGDWVELDVNAMSQADRKGMEKYFNVLGFVIGRDRDFVDVRFGNDRTKVHSKNLTLMSSDTKPQNVKTEVNKKDGMNPDDWEDKEKKFDKEDMGDMNPDLWPDDDKDDI